jgi:glycosyltransferase involved in cell wall biosynthesis
MTVEQCWQRVPGGSGSYVVELVRALTPDTRIDLVGVAARHGRGRPPQLPDSLRVVRSPLPRAALYRAWSTLRRPRVEAMTGPVDVLHATTWAVPGHRVPLVVTVHDLAFLREPAHFTRHGNAFFRRSWDVVRAEAVRVVVPSETTAADCVAHGMDRARIRVIPHGVRADAVSDARRAHWRERYGVTRPYILWCGTLEPRKNLPRLVDAYARAAHELRADLVLVGPTGWGDTAEVVSRALARLPVGTVHLLGRLDDEDLQTAFSGALVFAFPSLWEGFGMPVLEAMAHGVPVVTSAGTSMAEFVGAAGALVDPLDVDSIADGLMAAIGPHHSAMSEAGKALSARRTWAASAHGHAAVYREAATSR